MQRDLSHANFTLAWVNSRMGKNVISVESEQFLLGKEHNSLFVSEK